MAKIVGYNNEGYKIVSEGDFCEHWEPEHGTLVPMKECWCCKWSDFRSNLKMIEWRIIINNGYKK